MPNTSFTPQEIEQFLQQFFDVVGARQYIGARYVPIFGRAGSDTVEWDDLAPYEPLTVVMHDGVSYVSRRYVPAGIEISDTDYWVETYRFNAQVEQYRQEVLEFQDQIDNRIPFPNPDFYPRYGEPGQVLGTLTDGTVKWQDPVVPSDEQAEEVITQWLDDHPEATTTVLDGAITTAKLANGAVTDEKLSPGGIMGRLARLTAPQGEGLIFFSGTFPTPNANTPLNEIAFDWTSTTRCVSCIYRMADSDLPYTLSVASGYEFRALTLNDPLTVSGMSDWRTTQTFSALRYVMLLVRKTGEATITPTEAAAAMVFSGDIKPEFTMVPSLILADAIASQYIVPTERIANGAVTTPKLASGAVTDDKLASDGIMGRLARLTAPQGAGLVFFSGTFPTPSVNTPLNEIAFDWTSTTRCVSCVYRMADADLPYTLSAATGYEFRAATFGPSLAVVSMPDWASTLTLSTQRYVMLLIRKTDEAPITPSEAAAAVTFSDSKKPIATMLPTLMVIGLIGSVNDYVLQISNQYSLNMNQVGNFDETWEYDNWMYPMAVSQTMTRDRLFYGFTTSSGYAGVAQYDYGTKELTKTILKQNTNGETDDHDILGTLALSSGRVLCTYSGGHGADNCMYVRYALTREGIEIFSDAIKLVSNYVTTYAQLFEYAGHVYLFYRGSNNQWLYRMSNGTNPAGLSTWSEEHRFIYHNAQMYCTFRETTTPGVLMLCCYTNPSANDTSIRVAYLHLDTMTLYQADNSTVIGTEVALSAIPVVIPVPSGGKVNRLFEAAVTAIGDIKIAYCVFTNEGSANDGVYYVYDNGTITQVVESGTATWIPKAQNGIGWLGTDKLIVGRGYDGKDRIEIYDYDVQDGVTLSKLVADNPRTKNGVANYRTSKPIVDTKGRVLMYWEGYYNPATYDSFYTSARIYDIANDEMLV